MREITIMMITCNFQHERLYNFLKGITEPHNVIIFAFEEIHKEKCELLCNNAGDELTEKIFTYLSKFKKRYELVCNYALKDQKLMLFATSYTKITCTRYKRVGIDEYGAIIIRFCIFHCPVCVISCHFEPGPEDDALRKRNKLLDKILFYTDLGKVCEHQKVNDEQTYLLGGLNYMVALDAELGSNFALKGEFKSLLQKDELMTNYAKYMEDIKEIRFRPSYKLLSPAEYDHEECCSYTDRICQLKSKIGHEMCTFNTLQYEVIEEQWCGHLPVMGTILMVIF